MDTKNIVYQEHKTEINHETGEILNTQNRRLLKVKRTPDFIMLFTEHVAFIEKLAKNEKALLSQILQHYVGVKNVVFLSADTKKDMAEELNVGMSYIHKAIKSLTQKQVLIKGIDKKNQIYLNPHLFGKGNWENIYKMRQNIAYDFDFEKLEMKETRTLSTLYDDELENKPHEIIDAQEYKDESGVTHQEITIEEKKENQNQSLISFDETKSSNELDMLNAQNKSKELAIQEMKLKLEMKKEGLL